MRGWGWVTEMTFQQSGNFAHTDGQPILIYDPGQPPLGLWAHN